MYGGCRNSKSCEERGFGLRSPWSLTGVMWALRARNPQKVQKGGEGGR